MGESHQRRLLPIALGDTPMLRIHAIFLASLLVLGPASARAFEVFQDPTNTGTNPGGPVVISSTTELNLFIHQDGVAADPNLACSGAAGAGAEFCGWDLHIVSSGVTLDAFVPEPGTDIVFNPDLTSGEFRGNGGDPLLGQVGTHRIGTLTVSPAAGGGAIGTVDVVGNLYVTAFLQTATLPSNALATTDVCGDRGSNSDNDTLCDDEDPCKTFDNTLPLQISNPFSGIPDECLCGDFDGDGFLSASDASALNACGAFISFDCVPERDEVVAPFDGFASATDAALVNRVAAFMVPAYTLTCARRPEGTCDPDAFDPVLKTTGVSCF